jgi:plastocyanin
MLTGAGYRGGYSLCRGFLSGPGFLRVPVVMLILVVMACVGAGCTGTGAPGSTPARLPTAVSPQAAASVTMDLTAASMLFNTSSITVPAGASVVVNFHNREPAGSSQVTGIAHNFAVYDSAAARTTIFRGAVITGGQDITYRYTAPAVPGTYFFRCDVHPLLMNGTFIVR